ncbi:unnamed protein product, partial [Rotaria magnacalcarata]
RSTRGSPSRRPAKLTLPSSNSTSTPINAWGAGHTLIIVTLCPFCSNRKLTPPAVLPTVPVSDIYPYFYAFDEC